MEEKKNKRYRKTFTFEGKRYEIAAKSERELEVKAAMRLRDLEEGKRTISGSALFSVWAEEWLLTYKKPAVKPVTYRTVAGVVHTTLIPALGSIQIKSIKPVHCQRVLNGLAGCSSYHLKRVKGVMGEIFRAAVDNDLILTDPTVKLKVPRGEAGSHRAITEKERETIFAVAGKDNRGLWVLFMLCCGLRPQETTQLLGRHVDVKAKVLHVPGTKNKNAVRNVPLPDVIIERLPKLAPFDYVFRSERGHPLNPSIMARWWRTFKNEMNVHLGCKVYRNKVVPPYRVAADLTPYCLRHTFCTDLQSAGVPINVAKELMGHSDISLTAKIYTHHSEMAFQSAAEAINRFQRGIGCGNEAANH